jgi:serine/threonine-protein kinase
MSGKLPDARAYAELNALLDAALALPRPEQGAYLQRVCAGDPQRLSELRALLDNAHATGAWERDLRHDPAWREALTAIVGADVPAHVGDWRVVEEIGRGGMARVYRAERALQGFVQTAALKVMAPGALSADTLARFEQERRILARLSDARIARLYDGGVLADGRPWLAMEFVAGERLDRWCDARKLDVRARVQLVLELVGAVASAHRSLIVHRDIKPANALVTDAGQVKLLDFGIAKIVEHDDDGAATGTGMRALTPHYASPEQLAGAPITTATDVYQLGLMLYELLTGRRPHQDEEATLPRLARAVMERDVPTCTQTLRAQGSESTAIAAARGTTPEKLRQQLSGDLQRVLLKALARDPAARYDSAALFGEDLRRALAGQPVTAVPPSRAYRLRRFIARHRVSVAAGVALALSVIVGVVATAWQAQEALRQRDQARVEADKAARLSQFLISVFANADPMQTQGEQVTAKTLLDQARARIDAELPQRDAVRADLLAAMGAAYGGLGLRADRMPLMLEALAIERELHRPEQLVRRLVNAAESLRDNGQAPQAKQQLDEAEALLRADPRASPGLVGFVQYLQGMVHFSLREHETSVRYLEQAVATLRAAPDARREDLEAAQLMLSRRVATAGDLPRALVLVEEVVASLRAAQPPRPADLINALDALGSTQRKAGRHDLEVETYREALALSERTLGPDHFNTVVMHHNLATALDAQGAPQEAFAHSERALAAAARSVAPNHAFVLTASLLNARLRCVAGDRVGGRALLVPLLPEYVRFPQLSERLAATQAACAES